MDKKSSITFKFFLIVGILIFFYPNISDYVNSFSRTTGIVNYNKAIDKFDDVEIEKIIAKAKDYNQRIYNEETSIYLPKLVEGYYDNLNPFGDGMMGSIIISKIGVNLPIYHGTNEGVIQSGVGHLEGTSLPIGGESTHAVLSTHSGLPSSRLFTDLNKLEIGEQFVLSILGRKLFYEVDQITTVLPNEVEALLPEKGKDYVTLFTCTPYGINTHRLLVRGKRIAVDETAKKEVVVEQEIKKKITLTIIKFLAIAGVILIIMISILRDLVYLIRFKHDG